MTRRSRVDAKGRSTGVIERVVIVRRSLIHSPQYSALSGTSRALMLELQAMFNGTNNGQIFLSVRDATARLGLSDFKATQVAFTELAQFGWITETLAGCFAMKTGQVSRARAWHLNWIGRDGRCIGPASLPALDFGTLNKVQKRRIAHREKVLARYLKDYQRGHFAVEESTTLSVRMAAAKPLIVEQSTTPNSEKGGKLPIGSVVESTTHVKYHSPVTTERVAARRTRLRLAVIERLAPSAFEQSACGVRKAACRVRRDGDVESKSEVKAACNQSEGDYG